MTNAEMYKMVFGFPPDKGHCPTESCEVCPVNLCTANGPGAVYNWWDEEFKGSHAIKIEIIEHHTFAKPNDVSSIDFPGTSREDK